jgi:hypothetical protein
MNNNQVNPNNEVDMHYVGQKVKHYFSKANDSFFDALLFVKRYILLIIVVIAAGAAYGYYKDAQDKVYMHRVLLIPNFESVDYLYEQAEKINSKIEEHDFGYLASLGIKDPGFLGKVTVEPVVDIYDFVDDVELYEENDKKFDLFKLISESGEMDAMLKEHSTSKNYKYHMLVLYTLNEAKEEDVVKPILTYLNSNPYFLKVQEGFIKNLDYKIAANDSMVKQMDGILNDFSKISNSTSKNLVYYHNETDLSDVIVIKERVINKRDKYLAEKVNYTSVIKELGTFMNIRHKKATTGLMIVIAPIVFFAVFCAIVLFISYYKSQSRKRKALSQNI